MAYSPENTVLWAVLYVFLITYCVTWLIAVKCSCEHSSDATASLRYLCWWFGEKLLPLLLVILEPLVPGMCCLVCWLLGMVAYGFIGWCLAGNWLHLLLLDCLLWLCRLQKESQMHKIVSGQKIGDPQCSVTRWQPQPEVKCRFVRGLFEHWWGQSLLGYWDVSGGHVVLSQHDRQLIKAASNSLLLRELWIILVGGLVFHVLIIHRCEHNVNQTRVMSPSRTGGGESSNCMSHSMLSHSKTSDFYTTILSGRNTWPF